MLWSWKKSKLGLWQKVLGLSIIILATLGYVLIQQAHQHPLDANPDRAATLATSDLLATANHLQESFDKPGASDHSGQTTRAYLGYLAEIQGDCRDLGGYLTTAQQAGAAEATINHLNDSSKLCADLSTMTSDSHTIYTSVSPLMTANHHLKRYQTIPLFANQIRQRQTAEVALSIKQLSGLVQAIDYPTQSVVLLKQLQTSIHSSRGLSYYSAVGTLQNQLLVERQRYWTDYGDLGALIHTLQIQLDRYCQSLPAQGASLQACRQHT
jgi:hypothetical protein